MTHPASSGAAVYVPTADEPVLGFFHGAAGVCGRAVLMCAPFGWEDICSYRSRREWARQLAASGHPVLRIDLPSCGDSPGMPGDPDRLGAWTRAAAAAARWLCATAQAPDVTALGIGLGGIVAAEATSRGAPIGELVLWGVPSRGRTFVREMRAFSRMEAANIPQGQPALADDHEDPSLVVANGYVLSPETVRALEQLDLADNEHSFPVGRALLLGRDRLKTDERLHAALTRSGARVDAADGPGFSAMRAEPQYAVAPTEVFEIVRCWLADGGAAPSAPSDPPASPTELLIGEPPQLREYPLSLRGPAGPLFAVVSEPLGERRPICGVLLNAGPQRHTGPNRMWVETARRWAARGVPTVRVDLEAIGDSDGDSGALIRVASLYEESYIAQTQSVLDQLHGLGLGERFVVLGLCSGAYWGMHAALRDDRVRTVVMLNPRALVWDEGVHAMRESRALARRLLERSTWRRALRGEVSPARHLETARGMLARAISRVRAWVAARRHGPAPHEEPVLSMFDALRERRQRVLLVLTGAEPLRDVLAADGVIDGIGRWPNIDLVLTGTGADTHTLTPLALQREVNELIDGALAGELARE